MDLWDDLQNLADANSDDSEKRGQVLDLFLDLVANNWPSLVRDDQKRCAHLLLASRVYTSDADFCRKRVVAQLETHDSKDTAYIEALGAVLVNDAGVYSLLLPALPTIIQLVWMYRFTELGILRIYLELFYRCLLTPHPVNKEVASAGDHAGCAIAEITDELILFLFRAVCSGSECQDEALLTLLALNDHYMLRSVQDDHTNNKVYEALANNDRAFRSVGSELVVMLNRSDNLTWQTLIAKMMWLLYSRPETAGFLYTNDLSVLVNIILRQLNDLGVECEDLRNMYLRLLYELVTSSELQADAPELGAPIVHVLNLTLQSLRLSEETRRLAERCLQTEWLLKLTGCPIEADASASTSQGPTTSMRPPYSRTPSMPVMSSLTSISLSEDEQRGRSHTPHPENARSASGVSPLSKATYLSSRRPPPLPPTGRLTPVNDDEAAGHSSVITPPPRSFARTPDGRGRRPAPPPPPPPPRHSSAGSSSSSIAVALVRPPPPPPRRKGAAIKN